MTKSPSQAKKAERKLWLFIVADGLLSLLIGGQTVGGGIQVPDTDNAEKTERIMNTALLVTLLLSLAVLTALVAFILWRVTIEESSAVWSIGAFLVSLISIFLIVLPTRIKTFKNQHGRQAK